MAGAREQPEKGTRGKGELLEHPAHHRRDIAIIQRALNEQWDIPPELLSELPARLKKILDESPNLADRETVRIAQTLDRMVRTNLQAKALATNQRPEDAYQPTELHKHEHLHVESPAESVQTVRIEVELVDDWYGQPDKLPSPKKNGKAKPNGRPKKKKK